MLNVLKMLTAIRPVNIPNKFQFQISQLDRNRASVQLNTFEMSLETVDKYKMTDEARDKLEKYREKKKTFCVIWKELIE